MILIILTEATLPRPVKVVVCYWFQDTLVPDMRNPGYWLAGVIIVINSAVP